VQSEKLTQILGVAMFDRGCWRHPQRPTAGPPAAGPGAPPRFSTQRSA
jgi:hypothetical protein